MYYFITYAQGLGTQIIFSDHLFFDIVLPIVVFSAGYGARKSKMFQNLVGIGVVGVVGTVPDKYFDLAIVDPP